MYFYGSSIFESESTLFAQMSHNGIDRKITLICSRSNTLFKVHSKCNFLKEKNLSPSVLVRIASKNVVALQDLQQQLRAASGVAVITDLFSPKTSKILSLVVELRQSKSDK